MRITLRRPSAIAVLAMLAWLTTGCNAVFPPAVPDDLVLDGAIDGLSSPQLATHAKGDALFSQVFSPADGLGPLFNSNSCESCHAGEGKGHPAFNLTRFGRMGADGRFDFLRAEGGPQLKNRAILNYIANVVPNGVTGVARFNPPAVTGLGLLEAVDDTTLLALAAAQAARTDGINGRVQLLDSADFLAPVVSMGRLMQSSEPGRGSTVEGKYIGRFGRKASSVNLLHQIVTAFHEDVGLTTYLLPEEAYNPLVGPPAGLTGPEPNVTEDQVASVLFYLRTLRPPPRRGLSDPEVQAGETLFRDLKCAVCHQPTLVTGASFVPPLNRVEFHPFTDLLLHDMGPELDDGYTEGRATTSEWRTTPLWGLGLADRAQGGNAYYLHDGRARTLRDAIHFHGGEATASRAGFEALPKDQQDRLLKYLNSL
jgi:CxxC motif-containing protein (DUF1111 family)